MAVLIGGKAVKTVFQAPDPSRSAVKDITALVRAIREEEPDGVDIILLGLAEANEYKIVEGPNRTIAVLAGLIEPDLREALPTAGEPARLLKAALKPAGTLGFMLADGSVESATGRRLFQSEGYAALSEQAAEE
jgi:hypothetical protein